MKPAPPPGLGKDGKYHHGKKWMPAMYVAYFGIIQELANFHGYALCVHGSVVRDFDLIAVPFDEVISTHQQLLTDIRKAIGLPENPDPIFEVVGHEPHGRTCYTVECGGGGYFDISFTPTMDQAMDYLKKTRLKKIEMRKILNDFEKVELTENAQ